MNEVRVLSVAETKAHDTAGSPAGIVFALLVVAEEIRALREYQQQKDHRKAMAKISSARGFG